jgi:hypothetical protein
VAGRRLVGTVVAGPDGKAVLGPAQIPPQVPGKVRLQALDLTSCATSNVARIVF